MFGRQWFEPGSQFALEEEALTFERFLFKRSYSKAIELACEKIGTVRSVKEHRFWTRQQLRGIRLNQRSKTSSYISVAFRGFWPGFTQDDNEILNVLIEAAAVVGAEIKLDCIDPDLLVFSCFGDPGLNEFHRATRVLYLGENVRPDFSITDYSMTFDMSDYCGRNIYLPLWLLRSTKYAATSVDYQPYKLTDLEQNRPANNGEDVVVYIGNNSTPLRIEAIHELLKRGMAVECYGSQTKPVSDKIQTLSKYQYSLCFENTFTPGYVTEKIVDSFLGGSMPIYWGGAPPDVFNLEEYYACNPFQSMDDNIMEFLRWKRAKFRTTMPPLLKSGASAKTESCAIINLAKIFMNLF